MLGKRGIYPVDGTSVKYTVVVGHTGGATTEISKDICFSSHKRLGMQMLYNDNTVVQLNLINPPSLFAILPKNVLLGAS